MSRWRNVSNKDLEMDGTELNVLVDTDENGNNYLVLDAYYIASMLPVWAIADIAKSAGYELTNKPNSKGGK